MALQLVVLAMLAAAPDLNGTWEVQTMGSDRQIKIQHKGGKLVAHRVMWPEFEGEKYKLEHMYRGTLSGAQIKGELLVKEEELPAFEVLRPFSGSLSKSGELVLDGLPLKRIGGGAGAAPDAPVAPKRASEPPSLSQAPAQEPAPTAPAEPDGDASLFANIMGSPGGEGLFKVSSSVTLPDAAAALTSEGDALYRKGDIAGALAKFEQAASEGAGAQAGLLHRLGRCRLGLKEYAAARDLLKRALKLDPKNADVKRDYAKAKKALS